MFLKILKKITREIFRRQRLSKKIRSCNDIRISKSVIKNVRFNIQGINNRIIIKSDKIKGLIYLSIYGDNNTVIIGENFSVSDSLKIYIGQNHPFFGKVTNSSFSIGNRTSVESIRYFTYNSDTFCEIGDDCMISFGITLYNTDGHPIIDRQTKELINTVQGIKIGKKSWIGMNATILKNSFIPDNSIIGCNAVFSGKKFTQPYCAFAGNPAVQVRSNVDWDPNGNKYGYIKNEKINGEQHI